LVSGTNPSNLGQSVTFTATVDTGTPAVAATGLITMASLPAGGCTAVANNDILIGFTSGDQGQYAFGGASCYSADYASPAASLVFLGTTINQTLLNLAAAINNAGQGACGLLYTGGGSGNNTCYTLGTATTNGYATAAVSGSQLILTAKVTGTGGNCTMGAQPYGGCYSSASSVGSGTPGYG